MGTQTLEAGRMQAVMLDLDVHRAIEMRRRSFDETANDILRRALGLEGPGSQVPADIVPKTRRSRRRSDYRVSYDGQTFEVASLKAALKAVLLASEEARPGVLERLARFRTGKGRRIVARHPHELYPNSPQLIQDHAERLCDGWWFDSNLSRRQCLGYFREIAALTDRDEPQLAP